MFIQFEMAKKTEEIAQANCDARCQNREKEEEADQQKNVYIEIH